MKPVWLAVMLIFLFEFNAHLKIKDLNNRVNALELWQEVKRND